MAKPDVMGRIGIIHLTWKRYLEAPLLKEGWTLKQVYLLRRLQERSMRPGEIADLLYCDRPTASVVIANLEKKGLVSRTKDPGDGRSRIIGITPKGRDEWERLDARIPSRERIDPLACFDAGERKELEGLLKKCQRHLEASIEEVRHDRGF